MQEFFNGQEPNKSINPDEAAILSEADLLLLLEAGTGAPSGRGNRI